MDPVAERSLPGALTSWHAQAGGPVAGVLDAIADGFVPTIFARHRELVDDIVAVSSADALAEMERLAPEHGMFVRPSSGAYGGGQRLRAAHPELSTVVHGNHIGRRYRP